MSNKQQAAELAARLRDAVAMQDPLALTVVTLLRLQMDEIKDSLVQSEGQDTLRLQGAARHLHKLHRELTTRPPNVASTETTA